MLPLEKIRHLQPPAGIRGNFFELRHKVAPAAADATCAVSPGKKRMPRARRGASPSIVDRRSLCRTSQGVSAPAGGGRQMGLSGAPWDTGSYPLATPAANSIASRPTNRHLDSSAPAHKAVQSQLSSKTGVAGRAALRYLFNIMGQVSPICAGTGPQPWCACHRAW